METQKAFKTVTIKPCGAVSHAYVITARTKDEADKAALALSQIHACTVKITE